ncbi:phosphatidate cytidylyltransferase [Sungkyunkwania multivorans]|uniref:Phosphatidate cytidylyltransferase n=1 Tax=Sungkyunkwania multivorans TaxID=1173618 RepID=A0ABW3CYK3_9FLAO
MKELLKRALTGFLYVVLLLGAVFLDENAFDFLFLVFGLVCIYEFRRIVKLKGPYIFIAFLILWWLFIYVIKSPNAIWGLLIPCILINLNLLANLYEHEPKKWNTTNLFLIGLFYIGGGFIFLTMIPYGENRFDKLLIIGIFILIWVNDSFAYLVGRTFGRHKLFERISPKKTIEGFLGGVVFALIAAYLLSRYDDSEALSTVHWLTLGAVVVIAGTFGDLVESKFKRVGKVKDSGAILPGHGGLLDRLDSLVFAAPFIYFTIQIFKHVS